MSLQGRVSKVHEILMRSTGYTLTVTTEALQKEMVLPRPQSPLVESELDRLPEHEVRRLAGLYLSQSQRGIKRSANVEVKDEGPEASQPERPVKAIKTKEGEKVLVDLTGDD
ncbi:hypothetical protein M406DRAFT_329717 [Cryphonectria parasitica EP155]|uniref:Uncharacterized protein n=1 Tax=Cryphonectria parasitica (strain ATCC 38755 / EP155) TaxID=660469 RepID=A0A9P5CQ44_CRYP1|nr:uncharacterized protein M406DRAFT_329717 [Cryphonectria parasitica EP155]KAF3765861.1 hypothetical protein M406DRAFT_329717 [Cryphonectria parasitica EP155]